MKQLPKLFRSRWFLVTVSLATVAVIVLVLVTRPNPVNLRLDQFEQSLADGKVLDARVLDKSHTVEGTLRGGDKFRVDFPAEYGDELTRKLLDAKVETTADGENDSTVLSVLYDLGPTVVIIGVFIWFVTQMQGGGRSGFGKAKARKAGTERSKVTFANVAGADEAVEELTEIKEFLRDPERFRALGARIPRGVLLYGPPGTGKTLLARAVAGEADAPFFTISGSDFVEMFVGVGAARVRDLFKQAKEVAPSIVFVDEIDAVGRHRGTGVGGGHDEREQTLNQLLVELDGFEDRDNVILMAATNRPDILDPALLRPGRFDRQIAVDAPDLEGRRAILEVHAAGMPWAPDVSWSVVARQTPGYTGADLANIVNESALLAGRRSATVVTMGDVSEAIDRVMAGPERRNRVMSEKEKAITAYHEAGHALVGHLLPNCDPVHKVSIVARGRALGWTQSLPTEDRYTRTRSELTELVAMMLAGRGAEELVFGEITTGASDDIERATALCRAMVTEYGMSDAVGPRRIRTGGDEPFVGREGAIPVVSDEIAGLVDSEVQRLLREAQATARQLLETHRDGLDRVAARLIEVETVDADALAELLTVI